MRSYSVAQAKAQLSSLLDTVAAGETVEITRRGKKVAHVRPGPVAFVRPGPVAPQPERRRIDFEALRRHLEQMPLIEGCPVEDMRAEYRY
jgi:prevent-host-death family protein